MGRNQNHNTQCLILREGFHVSGVFFFFFSWIKNSSTITNKELPSFLLVDSRIHILFSFRASSFPHKFSLGTSRFFSGIVAVSFCYYHPNSNDRKVSKTLLK